MSLIVFRMTTAGVLVTSPAADPEVTIIRLDTQAEVVSDVAMTHAGRGLWFYDFTESPSLDYAISIDADPSATGQVTAFERYHSKVLSGPDIASLGNVDVAVSTRSSQASQDTMAGEVSDVLADTAAIQPTVASNLDAAVSSRASQASVDAAQTDVTAILADTAAIEPLVSSNLDAAVSSRAAPGDAMDLAADALDASALASSAVAEIVSGVWDALRSSHTTASTMGSAVGLLTRLLARTQIVTSTSPWELRVYAFDEGSAGDSVVDEVFELYDQDAVAIAGDDSSGNNPLNDATRIISELRRV